MSLLHNSIVTIYSQVVHQPSGIRRFWRGLRKKMHACLKPAPVSRVEAGARVPPSRRANKKKKINGGELAVGKAPGLLPNDENKVCTLPAEFLSFDSRSIYFGSRPISFIFDPLALGMLVVNSPPLVAPRRQVSPPATWLVVCTAARRGRCHAISCA